MSTDLDPAWDIVADASEVAADPYFAQQQDMVVDIHVHSDR